jgi:hypothetical protein
MEAVLHEGQQEVKLDSEENRHTRVTLPKKELHRQVRQQGVQHATSRGLTMQSCHSLVRDSSEPYGLEDPVQPGQGNPVVGIIEIKAEEEPQHTPAVELLGGRQDRCHPIKDIAASDGAELSRTENTGKDMKETSDKHFAKDFILNREEDNRTKLDNYGNRKNLWEDMHNNTPKGYQQEARGQHGGQGSEEVWADDGSMVQKNS